MKSNIEPNLSQRWPSSEEILFVAARDAHCQSLGPGIRAVLWLQGCCFRCPGCIAPEMLPFRGGSPMSVDALVAEFVGLQEIDGITFSGGEPFMQARALVTLIDNIKRHRDLSFMSYTGFTLDELRLKGEPDQLELLSRLDLLVDGRYLRDQHTTLMWRGSRNQRIHFLSERHATLRNLVDNSVVSLDMTIEEDGSFHWAGISPSGFQKVIEIGMDHRGVVASSKGAAQ